MIALYLLQTNFCLGSRPYNDDGLLSDSITLTDEKESELDDVFCSIGTNEELIVDENVRCDASTKETEESSVCAPSSSTSIATNKCSSASTTSKAPEQMNKKTHLSRKKRIADVK
jgi:hypothetical protein